MWGHMPEQPHHVNEFQRCLESPVHRPRSPRGEPLEPLSRHQIKQIPRYSPERIVPWAVGVMNSDVYRKVLGKSDFVIKTFFTLAMPLDHGWFKPRDMPDGWIICPVCGGGFPHTARYWHYRNKEDGVFWLDACRNCRCSTKRRQRYRGDIRDLTRKPYRI
jgi:hypothetical protein